MKIGLVFAVAIAALALGQTAFAQAPAPRAKPASPAVTTTDYTEQRTGGDQAVVFKDDALIGGDGGFYGFTTLRPPGILRAGLIRPRVNFVSELLKSVENL